MRYESHRERPIDYPDRMYIDYRDHAHWHGLHDDAIRIIELKPFKWETWVKTCAFENPFPPEHKELQDKIKEALLAEGVSLDTHTP